MSLQADFIESLLQFINPYFIYCIQVWGNTYKTYLQKLTLLQEIFIRIITSPDSYRSFIYAV